LAQAVLAQASISPLPLPLAGGRGSMGRPWKVVGGADKGGILVREGKETTSNQLADRLSTGAKIEELELIGGRLHYKLVIGTGPNKGWVGVRVGDKQLVAPEGHSGKDPKISLQANRARTWALGHMFHACGANVRGVQGGVVGVSRDTLFDHLTVEHMEKNFRRQFRLEQIPEELYDSDKATEEECTIYFQMMGQIEPIDIETNKKALGGVRQRVREVGELRSVIMELEHDDAPRAVIVLVHGINVKGDDLFGTAFHALNPGMRFVLPSAPNEQPLIPVEDIPPLFVWTSNGIGRIAGKTQDFGNPKAGDEFTKDHWQEIASIIDLNTQDYEELVLHGIVKDAGLMESLRPRLYWWPSPEKGSEEAKASIDKLHAVATEALGGASGANLVLGGFSQGAAASMAAAAACGMAGSPPAGLVLIAPPVPSLQSQVATDSLKGTMVLVISGEQDSIATPEGSEQACAACEAAGAKTELVKHSGGHEINIEVGDVLAAFLKKFTG